MIIRNPTDQTIHTTINFREWEIGPHSVNPFKDEYSADAVHMLSVYGFLEEIDEAGIVIRKGTKPVHQSVANAAEEVVRLRDGSIVVDGVIYKPMDKDLPAVEPTGSTKAKTAPLISVTPELKAQDTFAEKEEPAEESKKKSPERRAKKGPGKQWFRRTHPKHKGQARGPEST